MTNQGTPTLPMGPRYVDQCWEDFNRQFESMEEVNPQALIGYAFWWARERGVTGWSKARLANRS